MSDNRDYITRPDEMGNIHISEEVLAVISAAAALEVEGVGSMANHLTGEIVELLGGKKSQSRGVRVTTEENDVVVELSLLVRYGYPIMDVAKQVQDAVTTAVEATSGLTVRAVNVHVSGVTFDKEQKQK